MRSLVVLVFCFSVGCAIHPNLESLRWRQIWYAQHHQAGVASLAVPPPTPTTPYTDDQLLALAADSDAVKACRDTGRQLKDKAQLFEGLGISLGIVGLAGAGWATAEAATNKTDPGLTGWSLGAGAFAVGAAVGAYLLNTGSYNRQGQALMDAAVIQMINVDPFMDEINPPDKAGPSGGAPPPAPTPAQIQEANGKRLARALRTQWQTCAHVLAAWSNGAGTADSSLAGAFGVKPSGGGAGKGQ